MIFQNFQRVLIGLGHEYQVFWFHLLSISFSLLEQISEAISELEGIKEKRDVILCSCMALIIAHKRTKLVDKDTVKQLEAKLKSERTTCGETALYFAGMFLFHSGKPDKAREYIDRMLKMVPQSQEVIMNTQVLFLFTSGNTISKPLCQELAYYARNYFMFLLCHALL